MNVNLNKVKKRASLNGDDRISTENSEPFFKGSLVEICILSYVPYSFSEKHSLKHELMPFFFGDSTRKDWPLAAESAGFFPV